MGLTNTGRNAIAKFVVGQDLTNVFDNDSTWLGVGDTNTAFSTSQTNLVAASNKTRKIVSAGYPLTVTDNQVVFSAQFGTSDANYEWREWGVFNNGTDGSGTMLCRKPETGQANGLGLKSASDVWQLTVTLTLSAS